ncbi:hypothetical protein ACFQT0_28800 [Hymenobacter humi]|uniref:MFS transporter n=1 Tax=Hymenobacter humi TaxID=1411620 RepID=A0ABW2UDS6_9BACT
MPLYLQSIGFSVFFIGLLEGVAEAVAGLSKGYFGQWSDRLGRRVPFVQWGYGLRPVRRCWRYWPPRPGCSWPAPWTGWARACAHRRATPCSPTKPRPPTGARCSAFTVPWTRWARCLARSRHWAGWRRIRQYRPLFLWAFVPGVLAVGLTLALRERRAVPSGRPVVPFWASFRYWRAAPLPYRRVVGGLLVFALFNSSDAFLLLLARQRGLSATAVIGLYILYNVTYVLSAWPLGYLADRLAAPAAGRRLAGVCGGVRRHGVRARRLGLRGALACMACTPPLPRAWAAWVSTLCARADTGAALGTLGGLSSLAALGASAGAACSGSFAGRALRSGWRPPWRWA